MIPRVMRASCTEGGGAVWTPPSTFIVSRAACILFHSLCCSRLFPCCHVSPSTEPAFSSSDFLLCAISAAKDLEADRIRVASQTRATVNSRHHQLAIHPRRLRRSHLLCLLCHILLHCPLQCLWTVKLHPRPRSPPAASRHSSSARNMLDSS